MQCICGTYSAASLASPGALLYGLGVQASLDSVWLQARGITMPSDDPQDLFNILRAGGVPGCEDPDARARVACLLSSNTPRLHVCL